MWNKSKNMRIARAIIKKLQIIFTCYFTLWRPL